MFSLLSVDLNLLLSFFAGRFIGASGGHVRSLKSQSGCDVYLRRADGTRPASATTADGRRLQRPEDFDPHGFQVCQLMGRRSAIERCLEMVRERFPLDQFPRMTLEQTNAPEEGAAEHGYLTEAALRSPQSALAEGAARQVQVSAIESAGHVFLQQPRHPGFRHLRRLEECMQRVYSDRGGGGGRAACPSVPLDRATGMVTPGMVCAVHYQRSQWCRAQIVGQQSQASGGVTVKFLDWGGYSSGHRPADLKQIRSDFMLLPFMVSWI